MLGRGVLGPAGQPGGGVLRSSPASTASCVTCFRTALGIPTSIPPSDKDEKNIALEWHAWTNMMVWSNVRPRPNTSASVRCSSFNS